MQNRVIVLLLWLLATLPSARLNAASEFGRDNDSPFGGGKSGTRSPFSGGRSAGENQVLRTVDFDVGRVGTPGRVETRETFMRIWSSFRESHELDAKGNIQDGEGLEDTAYTQNAFLYYLSKAVAEVRLPEKTNCTRCDGKGYKQAIVSSGAKSLGSTQNVTCDLCHGTGGDSGVVVYRLTYSGKLPERLPPPPPSATQAKKRRSNSQLNFKPDDDATVEGCSVLSLTVKPTYAPTHVSSSSLARSGGGGAVFATGGGINGYTISFAVANNTEKVLHDLRIALVLSTDDGSETFGKTVPTADFTILPGTQTPASAHLRLDEAGFNDNPMDRFTVIRVNIYDGDTRLPVNGGTWRSTR